jgi:hypothetical protein
MLQVPPMASGWPTRWPTFAALAIALIALAVGLAAWFRSTRPDNQAPPKPTYTQQQSADAKTKVCAAFEQVDHALSVANALPGGSDTLVTALNIRQVFDVGSRHLFATLAEEPATPPDLATAVRNQASTLEEAVIDYQNGFSNSDPQMRSVVDANAVATKSIRQLCK